jgi:hypothetical protein
MNEKKIGKKAQVRVFLLMKEFVIDVFGAIIRRFVTANFFHENFFYSVKI